MSRRRSTWSQDRTARRATIELALYEAARALEQALHQLSQREAGIIRLRFGLTDGQPKTLDEIGQVYGVTRERIRQLETRTMNKLRDPAFGSAAGLPAALEVFVTEDIGGLPEWVQSWILGRSVEIAQPDLRFCPRHNAYHAVRFRSSHPCG